MLAGLVSPGALVHHIQCSPVSIRCLLWQQGEDNNSLTHAELIAQVIKIRHHLVGQAGKPTTTQCGTVNQVSQGAPTQAAPDVGQVLLLEHCNHVSQVTSFLGDVSEESASHLKQTSGSRTVAGNAGARGEIVRCLCRLEAPGSDSGVLGEFTIKISTTVSA